MAVAYCGPAAFGIDPNRTLSQYVRQRWGIEHGFPRGPVYSIAQTRDGYLWIGTEKGLIRFDGLTFHQMESAQVGLALNHVLGLVADPDGSLWVRLRRSSPTLLQYRDGRFRDGMEAYGLSEAAVSAMGRSTDGAPLLWVLRGEPSGIVLRGNKFETLAAPAGYSRSAVLAVAQTPNHDLWVGTRDAGLFRVRGGQTQAITEGLPDLKVNALVPFGNNELWVGTDSGVARWDGKKLTKAGLPPSLDGIQALALTVDRDSNLWVGTNSHGLWRVNAQGGSSLVQPNGSSIEAITALFEDREGDLWVGSAGGLERLRDSAFVSYSLPEGLPTDGNNPLFIDSGNRLWFASVNGGLWWMKDGQHGEVTSEGLDRDVIYSIAGGEDGLWVGRQRGGLTHLSVRPGATSKTYTERDGLAQNSVYSVYESLDGTIWAGTLSAGISRLREGRFTNYSSAGGLLSDTINSILEGSDGAMWFGTPAGLNALRNGRWESYTAKDGLPSEDVNCLLEDSRGVLWIGTSAGIGFRGRKQFQTPAGLAAALREPVLGLAEDRHGSLWVTTSNHVLSVNRDKLLHGSATSADLREYAIADGLRGLEGVKRYRSVVSDPSGRIWLSLNRAISVVDPARLKSNSTPALPRIESISSDGNSIPLHDPIHIPGGPRRVTFAYAGLSLSVPEKVNFRYRLDGFDHDWREPVATREVEYTNLPPGPYRFRVIASNPDGDWSREEASAGFEVDPLLWQTSWFRAIAVLAAMGVGLGLYRLRLYQLTRSLNIRFEERLAERTRIAQELHDTLLQGFLSASMQVHVVSDRLPDDSNLKPALTRALQLMGQVIDEGRNAVRGLRSTSSPSLDLEHAFSGIHQEIFPLSQNGGGTDFHVVVDGKRRPLHPVLRDEVYRIGREALLNAFHHAQAKSIELELKYSPSNLVLLVRDNGCGMDPHILDSGREGHWGLSGMRERADRIGAQFRVWSSAAAGTEVELIVPSQIAFQDHKSHVFSWLTKPFQREERDRISKSRQ
jgi:ligand-binding sensor domain-containing protein/signal transduction histidine kinase